MSVLNRTDLVCLRCGFSFRKGSLCGCGLLMDDPASGRFEVVTPEKAERLADEFFGEVGRQSARQPQRGRRSVRVGLGEGGPFDEGSGLFPQEWFTAPGPSGLVALCCVHCGVPVEPVPWCVCGLVREPGVLGEDEAWMSNAEAWQRFMDAFVLDEAAAVLSSSDAVQVRRRVIVACDLGPAQLAALPHRWRGGAHGKWVLPWDLHPDPAPPRPEADPDGLSEGARARAPHWHFRDRW